MAVDWGYFDKFDGVSDKYLPTQGEGETKAAQIVTAVSKLVYRYYNDGDIFDNTYYLDSGEDLSDYANWLYENTKDAWKILNKISVCYDESDYEDLLQELADMLLNEEYLAEQNKEGKVGTIYDCNGKFKFEEFEEAEDEEDYYCY